MKATAAYKSLKKQTSAIKTEENLKSTHIAVSQAYSANRISHAEWTNLRSIMLDKRHEYGLAWGNGI